MFKHFLWNQVLHFLLSQQIILSMHSGIHIGILKTLHVTESSLHLPLTDSLGNGVMFPLSRHSIKCSLIFDVEYVTRVLKQSGLKQNSTTLAIPKFFRIPQILTVNYSYEKSEFLQFLNISE